MKNVSTDIQCPNREKKRRTSKINVSSSTEDSTHTRIVRQFPIYIITQQCMLRIQG
jgi:hypothetical protein